MIVLTAIVTIILSLPIVLTAFFSIVVFAGLRRLEPLAVDQQADSSVVIVVPAHDEELLIGRTVTSLFAQASGRFRVLVVADNCTDRTADEARAAGAEVMIRNDAARRGKGFALAAARDRLRAAPPGIVLIVDADCRLDRSSFEALAQAARHCARPVQAVYLFSPNPQAPSMVQLSSFAFLLKNLVRQRGLQRLAGRAHLTGTGMAIPWALFDQATLAVTNIVEDLALGLEFGERGTPPMLVPCATVWSDAATAGETLIQRTRWEGGYLATSLATAPGLFARAFQRADLRGICMALDLAVPPLALLVMMNVVALLIAALAVLAGASAWPAIVQVVGCAVAACAVGLAWFREGRGFVSAATFVRLPLYVLWKLPLYIGLARAGVPREWQRTGR